MSRDRSLGEHRIRSRVTIPRTATLLELVCCEVPLITPLMRWVDGGLSALTNTSCKAAKLHWP